MNFDFNPPNNGTQQDLHYTTNLNNQTDSIYSSTPFPLSAIEASVNTNK